jgi:hypothetical protein
MSRWVGFFIAVILGVAAGLYYAWVLDPVEYMDTSPDSLLFDYKSDYILMVAEAFQLEGDPELAVRRLAVLGDQQPAELVQDAVLFGARAGYVDADLARMRQLAEQLASFRPRLDNPEQPAP